MSRFVKVKTKIKDKETLREVLKEMGHNIIELEDGRRLKLVDNNVYFERKEGYYEVGADWYYVRGLNRTIFMRDLNQKYAMKIVKRELRNKHYQITTERRLNDNSIELVLRSR